MQKFCGIYSIVSKLKPNKIYIGSSINIFNRWKDHIKLLNNNNHDNIKLQNHFNKYGIEDLYFSILLLCEKDGLLILEQLIINYTNPWFNICKTAGNCLGRKHSEETKQKIRDKRKLQVMKKGRVVSEETKSFLRSLYIGKTFEQLHGIEKANNIKLKISSAGKGKHTGPRSTETIKKIKLKTKEAMNRPEVKEKIKNKYCSNLER